MAVSFSDPEKMGLGPSSLLLAVLCVPSLRYNLSVSSTAEGRCEMCPACCPLIGHTQCNDSDTFSKWGSSSPRMEHRAARAWRACGRMSLLCHRGCQISLLVTVPPRLSCEFSIRWCLTRTCDMNGLVVLKNIEAVCMGVHSGQGRTFRGRRIAVSSKSGLAYRLAKSTL